MEKEHFNSRGQGGNQETLLGIRACISPSFLKKDAHLCYCDEQKLSHELYATKMLLNQTNMPDILLPEFTFNYAPVTLY